MSSQARANAARNMGGNAVANLLNPELSKKAPLRDHLKENLERLREKQSENAAAKLQAANAHSEPFKMDKFKNVESVVFRNVDMTVPERPVHTEQKPVRLATSLAGRTISQASTRVTSASTAKLPAVPRRDEVNVLPPRRDVNFRAANAQSVINHRVERADENDGDVGTFKKSEKYGKVPAYLIKRQQEMQDEEDRKLQAEADKDVPPGMIRMSEDERLKTIEMLKQNKSSVEEEYRKLPFRIETPSQKERQQKILERLKEIDDAIKVFSRSPVYISA